MASAYVGEEELDYEDNDYIGPITVSHLGQVEMDEDEEYEDLYSDVNVSFFQNSLLPGVLKKDWDKARGGFDARNQQLERVGGGIVEQENGSREANLISGRAIGSNYETQSQKPRGLDITAEPCRHGGETSREDITVERRSDTSLSSQPRGQTQAGDFASRNECVSASLRGVEKRGYSATLTQSADRLVVGPVTMNEREDKTFVSPQVSEKYIPSPSIMHGPGGLRAGTVMESGVLGTEASGTNGPGPSLENGVIRALPRAGVSTGVENKVAGGEGSITAWDEEGSSRVVESIPPAGSAGAGYRPNRDSPANATTYHTGRGSSQTREAGFRRLLVGDLHWWTTDADLESTLSEYGRVKDLKFFEERASGKSKGYCQVEFYEPSAARACKEGMHGRMFNGRPCIVVFASSYAFRQMSATHTEKTQVQQQSGFGRKPVGDDNGMIDGGMASQGRKLGVGGRGYGSGGARTGHVNSFRGRTGMGTKNTGAGAGGGGSHPYGQGNLGTRTGPLIPPQGILGQGYDPTYGPSMGRGGSGYGGFVPRGLAYAGMGISYTTVGPGGLPGVAPHINPAFFGRGPSLNGMNMVVGSGMEGAGVWGEPSMSGWGGEEHDQRIRENSYGEESAGVDYSYGGNTGHERGRVAVGRGRDRDTEGEWSSAGEHRHREDREGDWEIEKSRGRDEVWENEDYDRGRLSRTRMKPRLMDGDDQRPRPREEDFGKRRRVGR